MADEAPPHVNAPFTTPNLTEIAADHGEFLWMTLQRLGVRRDDCPDMVQNVLMVVHRKLPTYDGRAPVRAWLYGICVKEVSTHRRRAWVRRERPVEPEAMPPIPASTDDPERAASMREQNARFEAMLDELDPDKRAVLVMYEIEERSCDEIAALHGIPVGTVHSRLHAARRGFRVVLERWAKRDAHGGRR
jgi:RNA polymerase sigma-70 factor (ECF subfamily)